MKNVIFNLFLFTPFLIIAIACSEDSEPEDCAGNEGGSAYLDSCGTCDDIIGNDCSLDCSGVWGGENVCDCTDEDALNFNPLATYDDGSCEFDNVAPTVSIQNPLNGSEVSSVITFDVYATDDRKISRVELMSNELGSIGVSTTDNNIHNFSLDSDLYDNGEFAFYAIAYDESENSGLSETIIINFVNTISVTVYNETWSTIEFDLFNPGESQSGSISSLSGENSFEIKIEKSIGNCTLQAAIATSDCGNRLQWSNDIDVGNQDLEYTLTYSGDDYWALFMYNSSEDTIVYTQVSFNSDPDVGYANDCGSDIEPGTSKMLGYFITDISDNTHRVDILVTIPNSDSYRGWYWDPITIFNNQKAYKSLFHDGTRNNVVMDEGIKNNNFNKNLIFPLKFSNSSKPTFYKK